MDNNNTSSLSSSTPQKPHYIPEFYHHYYHQHHQEQQIPSPMSTTYNHSLTFNLNQDENENDNDNNNGEPDQNDEQQQQPQQNLNDDGDKEPMFEKPLTPSDVGKLNRLVIPKQHAEKYFPLGGAGGDSGLLLSFEDESGKFWRFRYSYWNSSQSYVLTKGWSRYVKEKRLDAGDVVLFERHRRDGDRLFIGWRRRVPSAQDSGGGQVMAQVSGGGYRAFYSAPHPYPAHHYQHIHHHPHHHHHNIPAAPYQLDCIYAGSSPAEHNFQTTTTSGSNSNNSKIVRLFGVNLECQLTDDHESEPSTPDGSSLSSHGPPPPPPPPHHNFHPPHAYYSDRHMDFTFSRDVKAMRNRRG